MERTTIDNKTAKTTQENPYIILLRRVATPIMRHWSAVGIVVYTLVYHCGTMGVEAATRLFGLNPDRYTAGVIRLFATLLERIYMICDGRPDMFFLSWLMFYGLLRLAGYLYRFIRRKFV